MTQEKYLRLREGDRWVALRQNHNAPVSAPLLTPDTPAQSPESNRFGLLRQVHLRHDAMSGTRHL